MQVNSFSKQFPALAYSERMAKIARFAALLNVANSIDDDVQEFNALALVPIPEDGRSFRPVRMSGSEAREDRSIANK